MLSKSAERLVATVMAPVETAIETEMRNVLLKGEGTAAQRRVIMECLSGAVPEWERLVRNERSSEAFLLGVLQGQMRGTAITLREHAGRASVGVHRTHFDALHNVAAALCMAAELLQPKQ